MRLGSAGRQAAGGLQRSIRRFVPVERRRADALREADPRLSRRGRADPESALSDLAAAGWSVQDLRVFTSAWPELGHRELSLLLILASELVGVHRSTPPETVAWSHALFEHRDGQLRLRDVADRQVERDYDVVGGQLQRRRLTDSQIREARFPSLGWLVETYVTAAGSAPLGLLNLAAGRIVDQVLAEPDTDEQSRLRDAATARGIPLP